jgi:hypothetical protein
VLEEKFIERLAEAIHQRYVETQRARGRKDGSSPAMRPWADLDDDLKEANRAQARAIAAKVEAVGARVVRASDGGVAFAFTDEEIERLAQEEHVRWSGQRTAAGWRYGAVRDDRNKTHPLLVEWDDLPEPEREKDRDAVRGIPAVLANVGLAATRSS